MSHQPICLYSLNKASERKVNGENPFTDFAEKAINLLTERGNQMYEDKTLICKECGKEFIFSAGEQEFYAEKGLVNEPQRCKECRDARKANGKGSRELFTTVCANCGGEAKVPFQPSNDRPVYCSACFSAMKEQQ